MTNNPKKPWNPKSRNFKKLLSKKTLKNKLDPDTDITPPIFDNVLEGLDPFTSQKSNTKKRLPSETKDFEASHNSKKPKKLIRNCFKLHEKTKKSIIPILSKQKTKKDKNSLIQNSKKTSLKKPSKYKSGNSNSILSTLG